MSKSMRTLVLSLVFVLVFSMVSFAAGEVMINGETKFTLKYDGSAFTANTSLNFKSSLKGTPVQIIFGDDTANGFFKNISFWDNWPTKDGYKFSPYYITANIRGAYYKDGPKVTTTLGDFIYPLPNYVAGNFHKQRAVGMMIADYPVFDKVKVTGFFAWPKYGAGQTLLGAVPSYFYNQGFNVTADNLIPNVKLRVYALNHMHQLGTHLRFGENVTVFDGVNITRGGDQLILYTAGETMTTNPWGKEALIGPDGTIEKVAAQVLDGQVIPEGKYVISGHGARIASVIDKLKVGEKVVIEIIEKPETKKAETTYGLETSTTLAGINMAGKVLYRDTFDDSKEDKKENQLVVLADADYTFDFDSVKAKINAGFRTIDQDFAPFARSTETRSWVGGYNSIEARRGQIGGNGGLTLTLPLNNTLELSGDYYKKESADRENITATASFTNSHFFGVTAKASATGNRAINTVTEENTDTLTTSASLAKDWNLPNKDKINTTYSFATTDVLDKTTDEITFTNKLAAKTTLTIPVIEKVGLEASAEFKTLAGETTPTYVGKLTHSFPNGLNLEAKATKAGDAKVDWYTQIEYKTSW